MTRTIGTAGLVFAVVLAGVFVTRSLAAPSTPVEADPREAIAELELRLKQVEEKLAAMSEANKGQAETIEQLSESNKALTVRVEKTERNVLPAHGRSIDELNKKVKELETRLRRVE